MPESNISYGGTNLTATAKITYSSNECCDYCTKTQGCVGYTFITGVPASNSTCHLKSSVTNSVALVGAVSAMLDLKSEPEIIIPDYERTVDWYRLTISV